MLPKQATRRPRRANASRENPLMPSDKAPLLPDWIECSRAVHAGKATALQRFLFDCQAANDDAAKAFRAAPLRTHPNRVMDRQCGAPHAKLAAQQHRSRRWQH